MKKSFQLIYFLIGCLFHNIIFAEDVKAQPTVVFNAVFWDRFTSRNLMYAPWGNHNEGNATILTNRVGFSSPSRSFAYYGSSPVRFLKINQNWSAENSESDEEKFVDIGQFSFEKKAVTQRFLILLLKQPNTEEFKIFPLPIAQQNLPFGSFVCYSQFREPLYLAYAEQKNTLAPGKSIMFKHNENADAEASNLRIFTRRDAKYEEVASEFISLNKERRAIVFVSPFRSRIRVKSYFLNRESIESSLGYESLPFIEVPQKVEDENSTINLAPISQ